MITHSIHTKWALISLLLTQKKNLVKDFSIIDIKLLVLLNKLRVIWMQLLWIGRQKGLLDHSETKVYVVQAYFILFWVVYRAWEKYQQKHWKSSQLSNWWTMCLAVEVLLQVKPMTTIKLIVIIYLKRRMHWSWISNYWQARYYIISGNKTVNTCDALMSAVQNQPISVVVDARSWSKYISGVFNNCGASLSHMVLLTGLAHEYWKCKNSWGTSWGENGYIRLARGNTCGICSSGSYPYTWLLNQIIKL